jgi:hypothetical protein
MARKRWIWDAQTKELVPIEDYEARPSAGFFISPDYQPYRSMATGEMVEGRAAHREHLKRNNLVEVGDAYDKGVKPKPIPVAPGLKETIARIVYEKARY